jgi:hypothetical protein
MGDVISINRTRVEHTPELGEWVQLELDFVVT